MKRQLLMIAAMILVASAHAAVGDTFEYNGLNYKVTSEADREVCLAKNEGASGDIVIPSFAISGSSRYFVTAIGDRAFYKCENLTSVSIPTSVTEIGVWAFAYTSLTSVEIPNSVTEIGDGAFYGCKSLTSVTIPTSVTAISNEAFCRCESLTSVTIPISVTKIGYGAFFHTSLTSVEIPNSVTEIGGEAFQGCTNLTSVTLPNSLTYIAGSTFSDCESLTSIEIPSSVTKIGFGAFYYCKSLTSVVIPDSVTEIDETIFTGCESLTSVVIPNSVTKIGKMTFYGCKSLTSIKIPNSVTEIGEYAFGYCENLTSVAIPNSVTKIGDWTFYNCSNLTSVVIPDSVTKIGEYAFARCKSLTSVEIPNSVTEIGKMAFQNCGKLTKIYDRNPTPQTMGENVFDGVPENAVVYIPKGSFRQYFRADDWSKFMDFREMGVFDMSVSERSIELAAGETATLKGEVVKEDGFTVTGSLWTSSDPEVATVDQAGIVTAVAPGKAVIRFIVIDGYGLSHPESCEVTVMENSAIEDITADTDSRVEVYTIGGMHVGNSTDNLPAGLYIVRQGNKAKKIVVR